MSDPADSYEPDGGRRGLTHRDADWAGLRVVVVGLGLSGFAAADALMQRDAVVTVVSRDSGDTMDKRAQILELLGVTVLFGDDVPAAPPKDTQLVVTSPGVPPHNAFLVAAAAAAGIPVWGEVELAWRMRPAQGAAPWLTITGTNGKTTAVTMLESILRAAGIRATAAGNVGTPILEAVLHPEPFEVLAVELSSFQLHWSRSISPYASCLLNVAPDHIDWHGSYDEYRRIKGRIFQQTQVAAVYNVQDPVTEQLLLDADVVEGCRAIGFTTGMPAISMLGVVDDVLADRAFVDDRRGSAAELATIADLTIDGVPPAPHYIADALAAAALARAYGVTPAGVRAGLRAYRPQPHRMQSVGRVGDVAYIDDSKATNTDAAMASVTAYEHIVWIAGGLLKGADVEELVQAAAPRLRAVVLLGRDRVQLADALRRHAPDVPVVDVASTDTGAMVEVVCAAQSHARPGDVVLLAPAAASLDMFDNYGARGDAFVAAVAELDATAR